MVVVACVFLGVVAGLLAGALAGEHFSKKTRQAKRRAVAAAQWMDRIHKKCIEARDVEPFAGWIADEIFKHLTKD